MRTLARMLARLTLLALAAPSYALDISGASSIQPVLEKMIPLYTARGGEAVKLSAGGSGAGIKNVLSGVSQIGMVGRALKEEEKAALKYATIGVDALAIVLNQGNPLEALSKAQLIDLYSGKIDNWKALGGPDLPVVLVSKEAGRATLELFEHYTGLISPDRDKQDGKPQISKRAHIIGANLEAATLVGGMSGAVGYLSVGTALSLAKAGMPIKVVKLDGVSPSESSIASKQYPIIRELNLVYAAQTPAVAAFIDLALSADGQAIVKSLGFQPIR